MMVMEIVVLILAALMLFTNIKSIPTAFNRKKAINVSMSMRNNMLDIQKKYPMLSPQTVQALFYAISFFLVGISIVFDILIYKTAVITTIGEISSINYIMIISMFIHFYFLIITIINTFRVNVKITGYGVTIENIAANIFYLTSVVSLLSKIIS